MLALNEQIKECQRRRPTVEIEEINISSYASPEGALDLNTRLAESREKNTTAVAEEPA